MFNFGQPLPPLKIPSGILGVFLPVFFRKTLLIRQIVRYDGTNNLLSIAQQIPRN